MKTHTSKLALAGSTLAIAALALAGCGSNASSSGSGSSSGTAPKANGASQVKLTLHKDGDKDVCSADYSSAPSGPVTFSVSNKDSTAVSEVELLSDKRILGERENVVPGLQPASFTVTLSGGKYQLYCPGATKEYQDFTVTGSASATANSDSDKLKQGTEGYAKYVNDQADSLVSTTQKLKDAVDSGDLDAAGTAYAKARPFYERIEPVAESFADLDPEIDARIGDVDPGAKWTGFHPIEKAIFADKQITADTKDLASRLLDNVKKLKSLTADLKYQPEELANGASGLLEEVQSSKITGEEEAYSHIDLVDFAANVEGSQQAFEYLKPALTDIDANLTKTISDKFDEVNKTLDGYKDANALGGYRLYTEALKASDGPKLTAQIQSLQEPLASIAEKVATT